MFVSVCVCFCVSHGDGRNLADHHRFERLDGAHLIVCACVYVCVCVCMGVYVCVYV